MDIYDRITGPTPPPPPIFRECVPYGKSQNIANAAGKDVD